MNRLISFLIVISLVVVACSGAESSTTTAEADTTTSTTTATTVATTTTMATTTTTRPRPEVRGADPKLAALIEDLYAIPSGSKPPKAPKSVIDAFADADAKVPPRGVATVATWDEEVRLAVVKVGKGDFTLAVANPEWRVIGGWWPSMGIGQRLGAFPKILAVVGSDARPDERRDETRSDSIHFVALDGKGNAGVVGVPRDSWVPIPGAGTSKINAALSFGGPQMMMDTFTELSDLDFTGYLLTGFAGFESLIGEVLGGLTMEVPQDFNDQAAKAYLEAGKQVLDGAQALALSRTRKTLARGDFQRQEHGGLVLMAAQAMLRAGGPSALPGLVAKARPYVSTDLGPAELLVVAAAISRVNPGKVVNVVAPGGTGSAGGASVVFLSSSADELWEDLADGRLTADG